MQASGGASFASALRTGEEDAWRKLQAILRKKLQWVSARVSKDDVVSEVSLIVWRSLPELSEDQKVVAWAIRIAVRVALREAAKEYRHVSLLSDPVAHRPGRDLATYNAESTEFLERIDQALGRKDSAFFRLLYETRATRVELETFTGYSPQTILNKKCALRKTLRRVVERLKRE